MSASSDVIRESSGSHLTGRLCGPVRRQSTRGLPAGPGAAPAQAVTDYLGSLLLWHQAQLPALPGWTLVAVNLSLLPHFRLFLSRDTITPLKKPREGREDQGDKSWCRDKGQRTVDSS